jgi:hypothetical protein
VQNANNGIKKREAVTSAASRGTESPSAGPFDYAQDSRPRAAVPTWFVVSQAALLGPLPSSVVSLPTLTLICFGLASAFLGSAIFRMPLS